LSVTPQWHERKKLLVRQGLDTPGVGEKFKLYQRYLHKMEESLARHPWLAGDLFSLADVGMAPYVNRLAMLGMSGMWAGALPRVEDWWERIQARPTFRPTFLDWCPPDLTRDLKTFGSQTWPGVQRLLEVA
jgi:glutathione S-transferase